MKNRQIRVARLKLKSRSEMENFVVTEVCFGTPVVQYVVDRTATLCARATVPALCLLRVDYTHHNFSLVSRKPVILLAQRGLTLLRFNFKVELEAATED
jgi:hypothetical protein